MTWDTMAAILERNWNEAGGYTAPNPTVYPWRWLWDSCFHVLLWQRLDTDRALRELEAVLRPQSEATGSIPHVHYVGDPAHARTLWGRDEISTITQPPMYGHAIRTLTESGVQIPQHLMEAAGRGISFFLERRSGDDGLIQAVHPWETGCDDSPRWDSWAPRPFTRHGFALIKGRLVGKLHLEGDTALANPEFNVGSVALTALVAINASELAAITDDPTLIEATGRLRTALEGAWDDAEGTFVDGGTDPRPSNRAPTLEAYLPILVAMSHWDRVRSIILDGDRFDAPFGPRQVDRRFEGYQADGYWRGAAWPQLNYLLWVAAHRHGDREWAGHLAETTLAGARESDWAEYWHPDTGAGLGAAPQSWTCLAAIMAEDRTG